MSINYDKSHGVIAFILYPVFLAVNLKLGIAGQIAVLHSVVFVVTLQAMNEAFQAINKNVAKKYGSWKAFQKNSKRDWAYCILGLFLSVFFLTWPILKFLQL